MTNKDVIQRFEAGTILKDSFHHADHVRLAFAYLSEYCALQALDKFCAALKSFAAARGKARLYHETISYSYFFLIHERMARSGGTIDWDEFALSNEDLFLAKNAILSRYYDDATLQSDLARSVFIFPDKCL